LRFRHTAARRTTVTLTSRARWLRPSPDRVARGGAWGVIAIRRSGRHDAARAVINAARQHGVFAWARCVSAGRPGRRHPRPATSAPLRAKAA